MDGEHNAQVGYTHPEHGWMCAIEPAKLSLSLTGGPGVGPIAWLNTWHPSCPDTRLPSEELDQQLQGAGYLPLPMAISE